MTPNPPVAYEFGGFTLIPEDRTLLHSNHPVELAGKDFEVLIYLVQNPSVLIKREDLAINIWGPEGKQFISNIPHHISRIRKIIGCDPRVPKYIKTVHGRQGYRFIAPVKIIDHRGPDPNEDFTGSVSATFEIACHLFIPMYVGSEFYSQYNGEPKSNEWIEYKEFKTERGTLHVMPNGFAVWHILEEKQFDRLWEFARWRKDLYREILSDKHVVSRHTRGLLASYKSEIEVNKIRGTPGYVFSFQVLRTATLRNQALIDRVLQILATPSSLETSAAIHAKNGGLDFLERKLLESKTAEKDLEEFGLADADCGFASWDSVSYQSRSGESLEQRIVDFEIAVQSLWWMSKCLTEILLSGDTREIDAVRKQFPEFKRQFARIKNISATESPSQRTMTEAILKTSRLKEIVDEVIELYNELPK